MTKKELAGYIDYTAVKATTTEDDVRRMCGEAKDCGFACVCVNSCYVRLVANLLEGSGIPACAVVGFPLGADLPETKSFEAKKALEAGAREIDMVMNVGLFKSGKFGQVEEDIRKVAQVSQTAGAVLKVIIETCYLTGNEIAKACEICEKAGADFVKTSTGFGTAGATVGHVKLMKQSCSLKVKASGGIRTLGQALALIEAGADRLGCSKGIELLQEVRK